MTSFARYKSVFINLSYRNNSTSNEQYRGEIVNTLINPVLNIDPADNSKNASVKEVYNIPPIEKASDWLVAVERMELSLNGVPFYNAGETIACYSRANMLNNPVIRIMTQNAYSFGHLLDILNKTEWIHPDHPNDNNYLFSATFTLDKDGFVIVNLTQFTFNDLYFLFPRRLNMILGISYSQQAVTGSRAASKFPRCDLGDELDHIILRSSLPCYSDRVGNANLDVLTDFAPPTVYSNSLSYSSADGSLLSSGLSLNMRQKLIYIPNEKRFLNLQGDFPLNYINVDVMYVNPDGEINHVVLPLGGIFELKLGFYYKQ